MQSYYRVPACQHSYTSDSVDASGSTSGPVLDAGGAGTVKALIVPTDDTAHTFTGYLQMQEEASGIWINLGVVESGGNKAVPMSSAGISNKVRIRIDNGDTVAHTYGVTVRTYPGTTHNV